MASGGGVVNVGALASTRKMGIPDGARCPGLGGGQRAACAAAKTAAHNFGRGGVVVVTRVSTSYMAKQIGQKGRGANNLN